MGLITQYINVAIEKKSLKTVIGRKELVDFPSLKLFNINAKIDTGAFTSAIHCKELKVVKRDGERFVKFKLLDPSHPGYSEKEHRCKIHARKKIKNSFGQSEDRYIIKTKIVFFEQVHDIELSLSDRSKMDHPVLIGRKFINNKFVVNVTKFNLSKKKRLIEI